MISSALKRFLIILMAVISAAGAIKTDQWADSYEGHDFPIIEAEEQEKSTTRIMSFNIRCSDVNGVEAKNRFNIGVRQILEVMPDSIGIQEATAEWMKQLNLKLTAYDFVGIDRDNGGSAFKGGECCPVFYLKTKFKLLDSGNFWLSETPDEPSYGPGAACRRICTWAKLKNRLTGETYVHVNTHFVTFQRKREWRERR
ncbi:MAG: hypothetical protein IJS90_08740 [Clostridia bacterium]|nr:hypothetical protein [Clostridia bacterium]